MIMEKTIKSCLQEFSDTIMKFLEDQGGYSNGYQTYVSGIVSVDSDNDTFTWMTPKASEELTEKGRENIGKKLYLKLQDIRKMHEIKGIVIKSKHTEFGCHRIQISYIEETTTELPMYKLKTR